MAERRDPDATVVLRRHVPKKKTTPPRLSRRSLLLGAGAAGALGLAAAAIALLSGPSGPKIAVGDETDMLAAPPEALKVWRFAPAPSVLVLAFGSLHAQALSLNRAAVFLELLGAPRDAVPDDVTLEAAIKHANLAFDSFYLGHDYRAADLRRLWREAERQGVALNAAEQSLRALLESAQREPDGLGAVLTLPPLGEGLQDKRGRAAILRHELAHGLYFTDPAYAAFVGAFWRVVLTAEQRDAFRRFLADAGYDTANDDLMRNEMQAYFLHTPDTRLFRPDQVGMTEAEAAALRRDFRERMPRSWLRERM